MNKNKHNNIKTQTSADVGIGNGGGGGVVGRVHDTGQRQSHNLYCSFIWQSANTAHSSARGATVSNLKWRCRSEHSLLHVLWPK